jgi:hypothetical protein
MFLTYGKDGRGELVHISEAKRGGACGLSCPFCGGALTAKQGDVVGHHFAHQADTCRPASASAEDFIPSYDGYFVRGLTPAQRRTMEGVLERHVDTLSFFDAHSIHLTTLRALEARHFLDLILTPWIHNRYEQALAHVTAKGLAFGCRLSLAEYAAFMGSEFRRSRADLEKRDDPEASIARRMLELEMARVECTALYLLRIEVDGRLIHKIGITARPVEARVAEVEVFLKGHFGKLAIAPLFYLPSVPYVEGYFKARYAVRQLRIGPATEYFDLGEDFERVQAELSGLALAVEKGLAPKTARFRGTPDRPRFRAVFSGYSRELNDYSRGYDLIMRLDDVAYLSTGERFADHQAFVIGRMLESLLGSLRRRDVVEFNAAERYGKLIRPTKAVVSL